MSVGRRGRRYRERISRPPPLRQIGLQASLSDWEGSTRDQLPFWEESTNLIWKGYLARNGLIY